MKVLLLNFKSTKYSKYGIYKQRKIYVINWTTYFDIFSENKAIAWLGIKWLIPYQSQKVKSNRFSGNLVIGILVVYWDSVTLLSNIEHPQVHSSIINQLDN